jgi:hypothetical protein
MSKTTSAPVSPSTTISAAATAMGRFSVDESLFAEGEGCVETERLISQLAGQLHPTMGAMHQTRLFELDEIMAHAGDEALPERYNPPDMTCR